jgi:hypothetical protein
MLAGAIKCLSRQPATYSCSDCNFWLCDECLKTDLFLIDKEPELTKDEKTQIIQSMQKNFLKKCNSLVTELVQSVKLLSSVSLGNQRAELILKRVASACYIETLLHLLPIV